MAFYAAQSLGIYPRSAIVKVGDTPVDVAEAHNAGMWAVAITRTGNAVGLSQEEMAALSLKEQKERVAASHAPGRMRSTLHDRKRGRFDAGHCRHHVPTCPWRAPVLADSGNSDGTMDSICLGRDITLFTSAWGADLTALKPGER
jgi:hypothetical protein